MDVRLEVAAVVAKWASPIASEEFQGYASGLGHEQAQSSEPFSGLGIQWCQF